MMAGTGRKFAIAHGLEHFADRCFVQGDPEFFVDPTDKILQAPSDDAIHGGDWATLHQVDQGTALLFVQLGRGSGSLSIQKALGALRVEANDPVPHNLKADATNLGGRAPTIAIINLGQSQKSTGLIRIPRSLCQSAKGRTIIVRTKGNGVSRGKPPLGCHGESYFLNQGNPRRESQPNHFGIT
jgi:hypothetical protein